MQPDFDKAKALEEHRQFLMDKIKRSKKLITTIDKTILHLRGEEIMKLEEIFEGFTEEKQQHYVDYLEKQGVNRQIIEQTVLKTKDWSKNDWLTHKMAADKVHTDLIAAIKNGSILDFGKSVLTKLWSEEQDISSDSTLETICKELGLSFADLKKDADNEDIKSVYLSNSKDAISKGVFGAPSFIIDNELFWGQGPDF